MVDSTDPLRFCVAKDELERMLLHKDLLNKPVPIVVFANKVDIPKAVNPATLIQDLSLDLVVDRPWRLL